MGARSSQSRGPGLNKSDGHLLEYFRQNFGSSGGGTNYNTNTRQDIQQLVVSLVIILIQDQELFIGTRLYFIRYF